MGTGRFAQALDLEYGVDPSSTMRRRARQRGIRVRAGTAEDLPYDDDQFGVALLLTTICFVDDLERSLAEARRVLAPGGVLLIGMIDRESPLGQQYEAKRKDHPFYHAAHFHTTKEVVTAMRAAGFEGFAFRQTLFHPLDEVGEQEPVKTGYGEGAFVGFEGTPRKNPEFCPFSVFRVRLSHPRRSDGGSLFQIPRTMPLQSIPLECYSKSRRTATRRFPVAPL